MDAFMFSYIVTSVLDIPWTCSSSTAFVPKSLHVCLLNSTYLKCESLGFASAQGFREKRYKNWFPFKSKDIHQTSLSSLHFTAIFPLPSSFEADAQSSKSPTCLPVMHGVSALLLLPLHRTGVLRGEILFSGSTSYTRTLLPIHSILYFLFSHFFSGLKVMLPTGA